MKKPIFLFLVAAAPLACEYTTDSLNLPYEERLVIQGYIYNDESGGGHEHVYVGRTLPLDKDNPEHNQILTDAKVQLSYGDMTRPLPFDSGGAVYFNDSFAVSPGTIYTLTVEWGGKRAWASTRIPLPVQIDTVTLTREITGNSNVYTAQADVVPRPDEVYLSDWVIYNRESSIHEIIRPAGPLRQQDASADGHLHFTYKFESGNRVDSVHFNCVAYDKPYYDYYISRGNPDFSGVPVYSYFEGPVRWNVEGDGVGLFVGEAIGHSIARFR